jgi:uncharacterized protein Yka (UPF0111/DUF47 family)
MSVAVKSKIVEALGESDVLLPGLLSAALAANDRIKLRLSLLQDAVAHARAPSQGAPAAALDLRAAGLDAELPETALAEAKLLGPDLLFLPGAGALLAGLKRDLDAMLAPLTTAGTPEAPAFTARVQAMQPLLSAAADEIAPSLIATLTSASREGGDKFHLLVMDLHKALNQLAATTAAENLDGAMVHGLTEDDRHAVRAFMRGVHRTAPLAFGHPGLGTTAVRGAGHLAIQNDIGTTDAHVLVVHVTDADVTVTYTDIHRPRAKFFIGMFAGWDVAWSPLNQRQAKGLEEEAFYLINGRFTPEDAQQRLAFLEHLGSRLVFLIDWNKARKALQIFLGKSAAVELLAWAAAHDFGHRAFLELGGAELVYEAVQHAATGRIRYGERLDAALGEAECADFLRGVLRAAAEGLSAGRSIRLIRDEIQADLARRFETAEGTVFTLLVRHLGLSHCMAEGVAAGLDHPGPAADFARRAKIMEEKADRLTTQARELAARLQGAAMLRQVIDQVENTADALEDCAWLLGLAPGNAALLALLRPLSGIVTEALAAMVRAVEAASRLPEGQRADAVDALQAIDAVVSAERAADTAQRDAFAALLAASGTDLRSLQLSLELTKALEGATDQLSHAAFALRERVLEELSA